MRLSRQQIKALSDEILQETLRLDLMRLSVDPDTAVSAIQKAITEDLAVEDRLNDEVRRILDAHQSEIAQGRMDYKTMFDMVKKKLVQERGIVL